MLEHAYASLAYNQIFFRMGVSKMKFVWEKHREREGEREREREREKRRHSPTNLEVLGFLEVPACHLSQVSLLHLVLLLHQLHQVHLQVPVLLDHLVWCIGVNEKMNKFDLATVSRVRACILVSYVACFYGRVKEDWLASVSYVNP